MIRLLYTSECVFESQSDKKFKVGCIGWVVSFVFLCCDNSMYDSDFFGMEITFIDYCAKRLLIHCFD